MEQLADGKELDLTEEDIRKQMAARAGLSVVEMTCMSRALRSSGIEPRALPSSWPSGANKQPLKKGLHLRQSGASSRRTGTTAHLLHPVRRQEARLSRVQDLKTCRDTTEEETRPDTTSRHL